MDLRWNRNPKVTPNLVLQKCKILKIDIGYRVHGGSLRFSPWTRDPLTQHYPYQGNTRRVSPNTCPVLGI